MSSIHKIFQILIRDDECLPPTLPHSLEQSVQALRDLHPEAAYNLLDAREIRSFICAHFSSDVAEAYDKLAPYSYKCDLARFCLLLVHGGLYVDIGTLLTAPLERPSTASLVAFRDRCVPSNCWALSTTILFAEPGRPELRTAIELIVQNCKDRYYGATSLDPTGPVVLGRALALCNNVLDYWLGEFRHQHGLRELLGDWIGKTQTPGKLVFVAPDGRVVGVRKPAAPGDLHALGLSGTNNYNNFWYLRRAYGESKSVWRFSDPLIHAGPVAVKKQDGIWLQPGASGLAISGPFAGWYATLPAGRYVVTLRFDRCTKLGRSTLELCSREGKRVVKVFKPGEYRMDEEGGVRLVIEKSSKWRALGVRLHTEGDCEGHFLELEIASATDDHRC